MMIRIVVLTCLFTFLLVKFSSSQSLELERVRNDFFAMGNSENGSLTLFKSLEHANLSNNPVMLAYRGASGAAAAGSVSGVRKKLQYFNQGKDELEKAVAQKPLDVEIRFLRLATQVNAPDFLGYSGDIMNDRKLIINALSSIPGNHPNAYLYQRICEFIFRYCKLQTAEKNTVKQLVEKFKSKK